MKILLAGAELFHAYRQAEGETDMKKFIVVFRNSAKVPYITKEGQLDWPRLS